MQILRHEDVVGVDLIDDENAACKSRVSKGHIACLRGGDERLVNGTYDTWAQP